MIEYSLSLDNGPSPNGKALDSDSSIFKVRILVGQLKINMLCWSFFCGCGEVHGGACRGQIFGVFLNPTEL